MRSSLKLLVVPAVLLAAFFLFSAGEANAGWGYSGWGGHHHHHHSHFGHGHFGHGYGGVHLHVGRFGFHYGSYPVYRTYYPRYYAAPVYGGYYGGHGCR